VVDGRGRRRPAVAAPPAFAPAALSGGAQDNLIHWIRNPQAIDPQTAMPNLGVTERDALDISAYLLSK
jgi:cytochrome c1